MGPLIPNGIIDPQWNNFIALLIGFGFGFVLESAGFSSSRKLAGVFYGYDFTVLRVFFTAAITAMIGMLYFNYLGWLDLSIIYINPAYMNAAIGGGIIMGLGFIMGGFCPGTSTCAAAIGKIDGWFFMGGMAIGILIFSEIFPLLQGFYNANFLGYVTVSESLNIPTGWVAFAVIVVALVAFYVTSLIQKRVKLVDY